MKNYRLIVVICSLAAPVEAASWVADARGNGMGSADAETLSIGHASHDVG